MPEGDEMMGPEGGPPPEEGAPAGNPEELGAVSEAIATGLVALAEEFSPDLEITAEEEGELTAMVDAMIDVSVAVEEGAPLGEAGAIVVEFLEQNPDVANAAAEIGAALLSEGGGDGEPEGGDEDSGGPPGPPDDSEA